LGRNPLDAEHPGESLLCYGPLTRTGADAALMQNVMSGVHREDLTTIREKVTLPSEFESVRGLRIAPSMDLGYCEIYYVVRENTVATVKAFEELGFTVEEVDLGWDESVLKGWLATWESAVWSLSKDLYTVWRTRMDPFLVSQMGGALGSRFPSTTPSTRFAIRCTRRSVPFSKTTTSSSARPWRYPQSSRTIAMTTRPSRSTGSPYTPISAGC
jgi:Asp-tRNA(Asn)/Glu-tRNA(Gln) amidotransferase A subunit family amidase